MGTRNRLRVGRHNLGLFAVVAVALALRLYGLNWDAGYLFHPDERHILMVSEQLTLPRPLTLDTLLSVESPLNPRSFAYGSLPFYLLRAAASLLGWLGAAVPGLAALRTLGDFEGMRLVGRAISAAFDVGTVLLAYALGRRLFGRSVGLLGAGFVALSVLHVQLSHFYASDTLLTFFVMATLLGAVGIARGEGYRWPLLTGIALGLALASKVSAAPVFAAVGVAYLLRLFAVERDTLGLRADWRSRLPRTASAGALTVLAVLVTFVLFEPYALVDFRTFVQHVAEQSAMARGVLDLPYTRQFANRPAYLYFLQNQVVFGLGLPLGLAALAGWAFVVVRAVRAPRSGDLLLLAWVIPYFAITGGFHAKFMRYLLPITPLLCLCAAEALVQLWRWARRPRAARPAWLPAAATSLVVGVVVLTGLYAVAFARIYAAPHPAVVASRWIYEHAPAGAALANEHWEEGLPVALYEEGRSLAIWTQGYRMLPLNLYEPDDEAKLSHIVEQLTAADYVVLYSNRLYGTIPRLPERYPLTSEYYRLLFGEQLGFELAASFASYPNLFGVTLLDDTLSEPRLPEPALLAARRLSPVVLNLGHADESFGVYDHPNVLVFEKTRPLSADVLRSLLQPALYQTADPPHSAYKDLLLTPAARAADEAGGTYRALFDPTDLANRWPVLAWALCAEVLGLAAAPLAFAACRGLADRGYLLAKTLGVLLLAWLGWMLVSLGLAPNDRATVFLSLGALLAAGLAALALQWREVVGFVRARARLILIGEAVFWVAFALFLIIRAANPDLWHPARGGEKPMDLAYLMATLKTATFPPYDPWFAGGYLNYYYFGQVVVAALVKLSGVVPTTAYNLAVPHLYALTLAGAFTVAYNLVGEGLGRRRALLGGLLAAVGLGVLGNVAGGSQLATQLAGLGDQTFRSAIPGLTEVVRLGSGLLAILAGRPLEIRPDWYWPSTRVIEGTINEFPYFTFLYADLHAHMIALPLTLLVLGLATSVLRSGPGAGRPALLALGLAVGALLPANSWDYPTYLGIVALAYLIPWYLAPKRTLAGLGAAGLKLAVVAALSYLLYLPFHLHFQSFYSGVKPIADKSTLHDYLMIHGLFLAALGTFLAADIGRRFGRNGTLRSIRLAAEWWDRLPRLRALQRRLVTEEDDAGAATLILAGTVLAIGALLALVGLELVGALVVGLVLVGALALHRGRPAEETFLLGLFATGLALGIVTELVAIDGDVGRMNTVFKFYLQVWVLWSIGAAVGLVRSWDWLIARRGAGLKRLWLGVLLLLFVYASVYPVVGTWARVRDRFDPAIPPTLDGTAYMATAVYEDEGRPLHLASDLAAIRWLWANVAGSPVVLEGHAPLYRWGARVSIYTGLPTVVGWDWHQKQQRWGYQEQVDERVWDVATLYSDPSVERALSLLRKYHVSYVYVGELERAYYPARGLAKFDQMVGEQLELVYDRSGVRIYRVTGGEGA